MHSRGSSSINFGIPNGLMAFNAARFLWHIAGSIGFHCIIINYWHTPSPKGLHMQGSTKVPSGRLGQVNFEVGQATF